VAVFPGVETRLDQHVQVVEVVRSAAAGAVEPQPVRGEPEVLVFAVEVDGACISFGIFPIRKVTVLVSNTRFRA
jgi:hypothetical protein